MIKHSKSLLPFFFLSDQQTETNDWKERCWGKRRDEEIKAKGGGQEKR